VIFLLFLNLNVAWYGVIFYRLLELCVPVVAESDEVSGEGFGPFQAEI
jgi:hypothetical protein